MRVELCPAYILHTRAFKESSLLVDCLTAVHGIVSLVVKGAKRPRSRFSGLMQPFILLQLSWTGRGELKNLIQAEAAYLSTVLKEEKIALGLYLNELILRLASHLEPSTVLFADYQATLFALSLADPLQQQVALREFEKKILIHLGYGLDFGWEAKSQEKVLPELLYSYDPEWGVVGVTDLFISQEQVVISGASMLALKTNEYQNALQLREAKKIMRYILAFHLGDKPLHSRKLFAQPKLLNEIIE